VVLVLQRNVEIRRAGKILVKIIKKVLEEKIRDEIKIHRRMLLHKVRLRKINLEESMKMLQSQIP
jgi:hypothetical protein